MFYTFHSILVQGWQRNLSLHVVYSASVDTYKIYLQKYNKNMNILYVACVVMLKQILNKELLIYFEIHLYERVNNQQLPWDRFLLHKMVGVRLPNTFLASSEVRKNITVVTGIHQSGALCTIQMLVLCGEMFTSHSASMWRGGGPCGLFMASYSV